MKTRPEFIALICSLFILQFTIVPGEVSGQRYYDHEVLLPRVPLISIWEHQGSVDLGPASEKTGFNTAWSHEGPWRERPFDQTMTWRHLNTPGIGHVIAMVSRLANLDPDLAVKNRDKGMGPPVRFGKEGETEITRWPGGKRGAVSLTWDDGSINQFRVAMPIMNNLDIPATFFINTARIPGSRYPDRFIGRDISLIIQETAAGPTDPYNYLERSSAARYLGFRGTATWFNNAAIHFRDGRPGEAFGVIDELYQKVRDGELQRVNMQDGVSGGANTTSWDDIRSYAAMGHEFASHTLSHPFLIAIDDANLIHEMVKSRDEIYEQLGPEHTFSMAIPYGAQNERVLRIANMVYPALRDTMHDPFFKEVNRGRPENAFCAESEYVKWMHEPLRRITLEEMKSWVDATVSRDNIWHIPVLHGVDGIGWEALPGELLQEYFSYIKSRDDDLWIATFGDVVKYIRGRMNSKVRSIQEGEMITVSLSHGLDPDFYNIPLTLKTYISPEWKEVRVTQGHKTSISIPRKDTFGSYVLYQAVPNADPAILTGE